MIINADHDGVYRVEWPERPEEKMQIYEIIIKVEVVTPDRAMAFNLGEQACEVLAGIDWAKRTNVIRVSEVEK